MRVRKIGIFSCLALLFFTAAVFAFGAGEGESTPAQREEALKTASGPERLRLLNKLAADYLYSAPDKSLAYAREAVQLGEETGESGELFRALNESGKWYHVNRQYEDAAGYYLKALELGPRVDNKGSVANVLTNIGIVYWELGNFQSAEAYHTRALELREKVGFTPKEMGVTLNGLGLALEGKGDYSKALEYYHQALALHREAGDKRRIAAALTNIGNIHTKTKDYSTALKYLWQSISAYRDAGYPWGAANSAMGAGRVYIDMGDHEKAVPYLEAALETAKDIDGRDLLRDIYELLSRVYEKRGDFKNAFHYHEDYVEIKKELLEKKNGQHVAVMKIKYETDKKGSQLRLLRKTDRNEGLAALFLAAAALLTMVLVVVFILRIQTGKRLNRGLRSGESKYRALFDRAGDAIFLADGPTFADCNEKTLEVFGAAREEIVGRSFADFSPPTQPDGRDSMESGIEKVKKALNGEHQQFYWVHTKKDGTPIHAEISLSRVTIHREPLIQAIIHDIGEREQLEAQRLKTAKLETVGVLAGGIAHDFRSLPVVIADNLAAAEKGIPPAHGAAPFLSRVGTALRSVEELSEKLLTIAEGDFHPQERLDIGGLIRDTVRSVLAESKAGVECRIEIPGKLWKVDCDRVQIERLIRGVVQNAVDAVAAAGGGKMKVAAAGVEPRNEEIPSLPAGRYIRVTLWDNGDGIPPEHLSKIFDPYFSTRPEVSRKGLGMGLTVAQAIVKRHRGAVTVSSHPDEGTTCRVYLPAGEGL